MDMTIEEVFYESPIADRYITCKPKFFKTKTIDQASYVDAIIKTVLQYFKYKSIKEIAINSRKAELVYVRNVCFYFLTEHAKMTLTAIGRMFGGKDHTTVIHGLKTLNDLIETKDQVRHDIYTLKSKIGNDYVVISKMKRQINERAKRKKPVPKPVIIKRYTPERTKHIELVKEEPTVPFQRPPAEYSNRRSFYDYDLTG